MKINLIVIFLIAFLHSPSLAIDLTSCGRLSVPGETYVLQNNVTAIGTCFSVTASDIVIDLNGNTVIYDNNSPLSVENGSFESDLSSSWDVTGASNATRALGAYLKSSVYSGSYALKVTTPTANQQVKSIGTVTLQPNTQYSLSGMVYNQVSDDVQMSIEFEGTSIAAIQVARTWRGFQYIYTQFTTGQSEVKYKINLKVTGASGVSAGQIYFDDIRVQQSGHYGVHGGLSWTRNPTVKNGTIIQGQAHGDFSHAIYGVGRSNVSPGEISNLHISVQGNSTKAIDLSNANYISIYNNNITSSVDTIHIRDHYDGALIYINDPSTNGSIHNNTITSGVQTGIFAISSGEANRLDIYENEITLQSKYTNDFAITGYKNYGNNIHNNTIRCGSGNNTCRGIFSNSAGGAIYDNTIDVHYKANSQEYSGCPVGGAYGIQLEDTAVGVEVYGNTVTANADECDSAAFRHYGPDSTTGTNNYVHNNNFKAIAVNGSNKIAASVRIIQTYSQHLNFTKNTLETNSCWLYIDGLNTASVDRSLVLNGNSYRLNYPKAISFYPLLDATYGEGVNSPRNVTLSNNIYADMTAKSDLENAQFITRYGYKIDAYAYNLIVSQAITNGNPYAAPAIYNIDLNR